MIFEDIFKEIGDFGRGQIIQYFLLCWPFLMAGFLSVDVVFLMAVPDFVCKPENGTVENLRSVLNMSVPQITENLISIQKSMNDYKTMRCQSWNNSIDFIELLSRNASIASSNRTNARSFTTSAKCKSGYLYSRNSYGSTVPNEVIPFVFLIIFIGFQYDLVCEYDFVRSNLKTIFFCGRIFGAIVFGQVSDLIGRLHTFLIVVLCNLISGVGLYFSVNPYMVGAFLLFQGFTQVGYTLTTFVLGGEMVGTSKRKWTGTISQLFYTAAFILIPLCYYGMQDWRILALFSGLPSIVFLMYFFCVHESPRWLLSKGRSEKALKIIEKVAKTNGVKLSEELKSAIINHPTSEEYLRELGKKSSILDLVKTKNMLFLSLNVWFSWVVNALIYYGVIYNVENLAGSLYLNFVLLGLVEVPAYALNLLLLDRIGRRNLLIISLWLTGVACLVAGCIPSRNTVVIAAISMVGKLTVTMSYGVVYFYTSELFPTAVRNSAMGMSSMSARVGGTLATVILPLDKYFAPLPMIIFASLAAISGACTFKMPETKGKPLDQNFTKYVNNVEKVPPKEEIDQLVKEEKV